MRYRLNFLDYLEAESISIMREIAEGFKNPAILFSGGKDSILLVELAVRAFWPAKIPFKIVHIDTGHNFMETIAFRDEFAKKYDLDLIVGSVEESIQSGLANDEPMGVHFSRNRIQSITLLETLEKHKFDALIGGARRDEEKARAKERFFSFRNEFGEWNPKEQRPELWNLFNYRKNEGEHFRVFPLNNWTELDVWNYISYRNIELPNLYFAHTREIYNREGVLYASSDVRPIKETEKTTVEQVRFRTIGDITCTGAIRSTASNVEEVIREVEASRISERGLRMDDKRSETAMEDRKKEGYF